MRDFLSFNFNPHLINHCFWTYKKKSLGTGGSLLKIIAHNTMDIGGSLFRLTNLVWAQTGLVMSVKTTRADAILGRFVDQDVFCLLFSILNFSI